MINLVSFITVALLSLQCGYEASAHIDVSNELDNSLEVNPPAPTPKRGLRKFVKISAAPPPTITHSGGELRLPCEVFGSPAPTVQWLKNGEPIDEYDIESNELIPSHPTSLARLSSILVATPVDGDQYTCVATSGQLTAANTTTIFMAQDSEDFTTLQELLRIPSSAPLITSVYNELFQDVGTTAILRCRVHSDSKFQVFWQDKHGKLVYNNSRMRVLPSGDLLLSSLVFGDMGLWKCTAHNSFGKDLAEVFLYPTLPRKL